MRRAFGRVSIAVEVKDHETPARHEAVPRDSAGRRSAGGRRPGTGISTARLGVAAELTPYRDWTKPVAAGLYIDNGGGPRALAADHVGARDALVVAATDTPALPLIGRYSGLPQVPALVEWRVFHGGTATAWKVAVDFRQTEPLPHDFWHVFAAGTYQNIPVFEHRCYTATPGRYLFRLGLEASRLAAGSYRLEVRVTDIRRNSSVSSWPLRIARAGAIAS